REEAGDNPESIVPRRSLWPSCFGLTHLVANFDFTATHDHAVDAHAAVAIAALQQQGQVDVPLGAFRIDVGGGTALDHFIDPQPHPSHFDFPAQPLPLLPGPCPGNPEV